MPARRRKGPKEWHPRDPYSAESILQALKELAPSVAFMTSREEDKDFVWDGDGPDPREEGFIPYEITVEAAAVVEGEFWRAAAYLGGSYMKPNEFDEDIHGYLPQLLDDAAKNFMDEYGYPSAKLTKELNIARDYLKQVMKARYERDQRRGEIDRGGG